MGAPDGAKKATVFDGMLSSAERPVEPPEAARELIENMRRPWGLQSLALGWMKLDVLARFLLVTALGVAPVLMTYDLDRRFAESADQLRERSTLAAAIARDPAAYGSADRVTEVGRRYAELVALTEQYRGDLEKLNRLHVIALSILGVLAVLVSVGQYRRYLAVRRVKIAADFLCTPEGVAWLQQHLSTPRSETVAPP